ncbi:hypothetical protein DFR50_106150 [Roseiarcus fermentans]|uniref:Uncharacterized protein n=1 Tax=Roseiarcus fermentans TaxID=1473586 RepID=A0A366FNI2_9HYPH|nr:hypothetical protein [Roseiarcus fermentans]RBP16188.1 hypothetical protein DFR50_106150 [Roseiarcus fermentans]
MVAHIFTRYLGDVDQSGDNASDVNPFDQTNDPFASLDPFSMDVMHSGPVADWLAGRHGEAAAGPGASSGGQEAATKASDDDASNASSSPLSSASASKASSAVVQSSSVVTLSSGNTTQVVSTAGSGIVFDNTYTASCTASFEACIVAAEDQIESLIAPSGKTAPDTIVVTFQEANSGNNHVALGNNSGGFSVSYATLQAALKKYAPGDVLPATDPSNGASWYVPYAYGRMLGLTSTTGGPDLSVTLNSFYSWTFGQDVVNGLTHELSEGGLGRIGGLGGTAPTTPSSSNDSWSVMDLFRYTAAGKTDYSNGRDGQTTYFSSNGGATLSDQNDAAQGEPTLSYNNQYNSNGTQANKGDTADWTQTQLFGATGTGETLTLTQTELDVLEALGWKISLKQDVFTAGLGGWETATDWSAGSTPITPQDASIGGASGAAIVTLNANVTINSVATSANSELAIGTSQASTLIAVHGTVLNSEDTSSVASGNLGKIGVIVGSALQIGGTFDNAGTLAIGTAPSGKGAGTNGDLYIDDTSGPVTLNGGGTVDLGQAANAGQSLIHTTGSILNAPGTSGDGLINVNNTITGGGTITLGRFDNQASGRVQASQAGGAALQISASTFTNEGVMTAESGATLDLGKAGATETLTDTGNGTTTGAVLVDSGAHLAISGNLTAAGSGGIALKGAGAAITSDGTGATTFTNAGTIALEPSLGSPGAYSGQIGDQGVLGVNDLTFVNAGTTFATGSGNTLTINTGAKTITNSSAGKLDAESGATLALVSNVSNSGDILAGTGSSSASGATTGVVDLGADGGVGSMSNAGLVAVYAGSDLAISGAYTISGGASGTIGLKGAGADITSDGKGPATFTNASSILATASGQIGDQGIKTSNDLTFVNKGSVTASGTGVTLTINTGGDVINDGGGTLEAENGATLKIMSAVHTAQGGLIEAASGGTVILSAGVASGVSGSSAPGEVEIAGGVVAMQAGASVGVPILFTAGGTLDLIANTAVTVGGSNGAISAATGDAVTVASGTGDTITGSGDTIHNGSGTGVTIKGTGDVVYAGLSDSLTDGGASTVFKINGNVGSLKIAGVANDLHGGVIDLLNGTGGYATGAAAFNALTSDGSGGSLLSLGADGSIDLAGVAKSKLSASSFQIG